MMRSSYVPILLTVIFNVESEAAFLFSNCSASTINLTNSSPSGAGIATCSQFNPALGSLYGYSIAGINSSGGPTVFGTFTVQNDQRIALTAIPGPVFSIVYDSFPNHTPFSGISLPFSVVDLPAGSAQTISGSVTIQMIQGNHPNLSPYIGTGTFQIPFTTSFISNGFYVNLPTQYDVRVYGGITMVYEYDTPEPSSISLLAAGLCGLSLAVQRRQVHAD